MDPHYTTNDQKDYTQGMDLNQKTNGNVDAERPKPKKNHLIIKLLSVFILLASLIGTFIYLSKNGIIYYGFKESSQVVSVISKACSKSDVDKYNSLVTNEMLVDVEKDIENFYNDIKSRDDNTKDATCQQMLFGIAFMKTEVEPAKKYLANLKRLNKEGVFPDNNIYNIMDINQAEILITPSSGSDQ